MTGTEAGEVGIKGADVGGAIAGLTGCSVNTERQKGKSSFNSGGLCSVKEAFQRREKLERKG